MQQCMAEREVCVFDLGSAIIANEQRAGLDLSVLIVNQCIYMLHCFYKEKADKEKCLKTGDRCPQYIYSNYFK